MPKRSNDFQRLIAFIEEQLAPEGVTVRESVMLREIDSDEEREVDVVIEGRSGHHDFRFAVECRDHKRKQGRPWIDSLEGRYRHLPVDKVIAVSRSGFYDSAYRRAETAKITLLSLEEALAADWVDRVANYHMGLVLWYPRLVQARAIYRHDGPPGLTSDEIRGCPIGPKSAPPDSTFEADVLSLYKRHAEAALREWIAENFREAWAKGPEHEWDIRVPFTATDRFLHAPGGTQHELAEIQLFVKAHYELHRAAADYYTYNDARVATGIVEHPGDGSTFRFTMLFDDEDSPRAMNVRTESLEAGNQST